MLAHALQNIGRLETNGGTSMATPRKLISVLVIAFAMTACGDPAVDTTTEDNPQLGAVLTALPDVGDGKADSAATTAEKRQILLRMKARLPVQRRFKADLAIGETVDGYVAIPPQGTPAPDAGYAKELAAFVEAENMDRSDYYEIILAGHARALRQGLKAERPKLRDQVADELCRELPPTVPCSEIAASVIDAALEVAFEEAIGVALDPIRSEIERVHGRFWQRRTTKGGEWIEKSDDEWTHRRASASDDR